MSDLGNVTNSLLEHATDIAHIWLNVPWRRREFGDREMDDLHEAYLKLGLLLSAMETKRAA
jgi:hypothetical protein